METIILPGNPQIDVVKTMKNKTYIWRCLVGLMFLMPASVFGQTDTTNVWFSNGPTGLLIVPAVVINPNFPDTIFAGSLGGTVARSVNRGSSWTTVGASIADSILALAIARSNTAVIYAGTLNRGVYKSTDHGVTWAATGLTGVQVSAVAIDPNDVNKVYAGTRDSLVKTSNGGTSWSKANLDSVNVSAIAMDPLMPDTVYVGTTGRGLYRSFNDGSSWSGVNTGLTTNNVAEIDVHPTQSDTLYLATTSGVFKSTNGGNSWQSANNGVTAQNLISLQIAPSEPNVIYIGSATGQVFKSTDHAGIWSDISRNLNYGIPISALAIAPDSSNVVYVGTGPLSNLGVQRLKQTGLGGITTITTGLSPEMVVTGDLNRDGVTDMVVANGGENDLSVFLTSSLGSVLTRRDFIVGSGPVMVRAGDMDGDGDLDLVAANHVKRTVSVLLNDSTGVFGSPRELFVGAPVRVLALADFDRDRDVDIAVAEGSSGTIFIYRNDGAASFEAPEAIQTVNGISDLIAVDLNGDGIPDLAAVSQSQNRLILLTNSGTATFQIHVGNPFGLRPGHLVSGDFDIDGDIDLALSNANSQVSVFMNNDGFHNVVPLNYSLPDTASGLVVADVDLDLYPDLVVPTGNGRVAALVNDGNGAFLTTLNFGNISSVGRVGVADLNSDSQLDILVSNPTNSALTIFANTVAASIKAPAPPIGVGVADVQGDLGGNARLTWKRPRVDERTGRTVAYRIMRALNRTGTYAQIARVDTSSSRGIDSTFVFRSYVDSNATVGVPYFYYMLSESSGGLLSSSSDTVTTISKAQPFFDFSFSDNSPYHVRDTIKATIRLNAIGHDVQSFSLFLGVDTSAVTLLDQDSAVTGLQPIAVDTGLAQARVLQNRMDPLDLRKMDFGLGFLPTLSDSTPVAIGSFRMIAKKDTTTLIQVLNDTSAARQSVLTNRSDGSLIRPFVSPSSKLIFKNHRLRGTIALQGMPTDDRAIDVRLDLTQNTALGTPLTTPYHSPNDTDLKKGGIQITLSKTGTFELTQVPVGRYTMFAKPFHYLRGRVLRDSIVVTNASGASPVTFKWISVDSTKNLTELRAGDGNNDNRIDLADFGLLAAHFGASGFAVGSSAWGADFNSDGVVNLADFALLQSNFGELGMGRTIATKPVVVAARVRLGEGRVYIDQAVNVSGVSMDIVTSEEWDGAGVMSGNFWGDANPMVLIRHVDGTTHYRVAAVLGQGRMSGAGDVFVLPHLPGDARIERVRILTGDGIVAWGEGAELPSYVLADALPTHPELSQNFPNPFNPDTVIPFAVSEPTQVMLTVYSSLGQVVRSLVHDVIEPGYHQMVWDGRDESGHVVSSGVYLIRFQHGDFVHVRKALLVK